jgi:hypothetical protein
MGHLVVDDADNIAELRRIAPDLAPSIAKLRVPAYILDRSGTVRWMNAAAVSHFGDLRGRRIRQVVAPEYLTLAKQEFAAKLIGTTEATEGRVIVRTADGQSIPVDISSSQLVQGDSIVGVFGLADPTDEPVAASMYTPHLTPTPARCPAAPRGRPLDRAHRARPGNRDRNRAESRSGDPRAAGRPQPPGGSHPRARAEPDLTVTLTFPRAGCEVGSLLSISACPTTRTHSNLATRRPSGS